MASIVTSSGWMTSFIYKQDLTSYYMNNVLTGTFRPGVYNANIAIVMNDDNVFLSIKKGTTLLFSNNYTTYGPHGKRRNFSGTDNLNYNVSSQTDADSLVMIKCVAQNDIIQKIANLADIFSENSPRELYVFAYVEYQKSSEDGTESVPYFRLASAQDESRNPAVNVTYKNFLYKTVYPAFDYNNASVSVPAEGDQSYWLLPDGCIDYTVQTSVRNIANFSFLMLGVLSCDKLTADKTLKHYHMTFTGRGLPEYRYSMISDHNSMSPAFIVDQRTGDSGYCAYGFLDMPDTLITDVLFNQRLVSGDYSDLSWEQLYDNNDKISDASFDTNVNFIVNDIDTEKDSGLVIDFIFGITKSTAVATQEINFLSQDASMSLAKETVIQYFESNSENKSKIFDVLNYYDDNYWVESSSVTNTNTSFRIIPLDICERNISRLSSLIQNKNLWEQVIDKYRINHNMSNFTDIVPIAIAFRMFSASQTSITHCSMSDYETAPFFGSYLDTTSKVNPINVLSYFDLMQKKYKANVLDTKSSNIYNQIPIR